MRKLLANFITLCLLLCMLIVPLSAYSPVTLELQVQCTELGGTFEITSPTENAPMPSKTQILVGDKSIGKFSMDYTEPGEYTYVIQQVKGKNANIEREDTVYNIHVIVYSTEKETLNVVANITKSGETKKVDKITYLNKEKPTETTQTTTQTTQTTTQQTTTTTTEHKTDTGDFARQNYGYIFLIVASLGMVAVLTLKKKGEGNKND